MISIKERDYGGRKPHQPKQQQENGNTHCSKQAIDGL
jgi:hypothetical protein